MKKIIKIIWLDIKKHAPAVFLIIALLIILAIINWLSGGVGNKPSEQSAVADIDVIKIESFAASPEEKSIVNLEGPTVSMEDILNTFPLTKGSYWIYDVFVKWTKGNNNEVIKENFIWKTEVIDTAVYKNIMAVHLKGFPWELDWYYEGNLEPDDYSVIIVDAKKFYLLEDTGAFEQIKNKENLTHDLNDDNLWFDFPLTLGKTYAYFDERTKQREDHYYQWYVKSESTADLGGIRGVSLATIVEKEYEVEFYTLPGHRTINFVPGIGMTGYTYVHHGTISEAYLELVEFYIEKTQTDKLGGSSQDKSLTLFTRNYSERPRLYGGNLDNEIWIKNNNTGEEKLLVKSGTYSEKPPFGVGISSLCCPIFSLDDKKVYFVSAGWVTSPAIFSVDVSTGELRFITDGYAPIHVITKGEYKDNLIVLKLKYYGSPHYGSYDHYYIITDANEELKDLGEEFNKEDFGI